MEIKYCKKPDCNVELVVGDNWTPSSKKIGDYRCKNCRKKYMTSWEKNNPGIRKRNDREYRLKLGSGIYVVELFGIPLYVGEGQFNQRERRHLKWKINDNNDSLPAKYCKTHDIPRKYLSFNVLEYEDNKQRMENKECYYRHVLQPIINSLSYQEYLDKLK